MQITINIDPTSKNNDRYNWSVLVSGDGPTNDIVPRLVQLGDLQDHAASAIADAVAEVVKNAEIY